ncbi:hypothetical protein D3C84_908650 [compost metagenome]
MLFGPGQDDVFDHPAISGSQRQAAAIDPGHANHLIVQWANAAGFQMAVAAQVIGAVAGDFCPCLAINHTAPRAGGNQHQFAVALKADFQQAGDGQSRLQLPRLRRWRDRKLFDHPAQRVKMG